MTVAPLDWYSFPNALPKLPLTISESSPVPEVSSTNIPAVVVLPSVVTDCRFGVNAFSANEAVNANDDVTSKFVITLPLPSVSVSLLLPLIWTNPS